MVNPTITAGVMNNLDQLYTANGQGIQPLYSEDIGLAPAFTHNNVVQAVNNGCVPVYVMVDGETTDRNYVNIQSYAEISGDTPEYIVYTLDDAYTAYDPDDYLIVMQ